MQIFRTSLNLTGTNKETYLRTGDIEKELKREAAERHALLMEWAFIFGQRTTNSTATPRDRTTGGFIEYINGLASADQNVVDFGGYLTKSAWEGFLEDLFEVPGGSQEKLLLCGNKALTALNAMAQAYGTIQLTPGSTTYGMKFMQYETPYGTLQVKQHPLLSQNPIFNDWGLAIDTRNLVYRSMRNRDTKFLKDRQSPGQDQIIHEFLTECGLEFRHGKTHGYFKNATAFQP